jgi:hypothetical protein
MTDNRPLSPCRSLSPRRSLSLSKGRFDKLSDQPDELRDQPDELSNTSGLC